MPDACLIVLLRSPGETTCPNVTYKGAIQCCMQVFLRSPGEDHLPLVYAASWWSADHVDKFLRDKQQPIWASLSQGHIELFREIQQVHYGNSEFLEE